MKNAEMTGNEGQVEWAARIKPRVGAEFDRVVRLFEGVGAKQREPARSETQTIVAVVRELRANVMAHDDAGYFIRVWQDLKDQVRQMISQDPRFREIQASRALRKSTGA